MWVMIASLLVTVLMTFLSKIPLAVAMKRQAGYYDNAHPRVQQAQLTGFAARALGAHKNCFEAVAYFAPAVLTVMVVDAIDVFAQVLALVFVGSRLLYLICYWFNIDVLRSVSFLVGFGCSILLLVRVLWALP